MMRARRARRHIAAAVVGIGLGVVAADTPAVAADRAYELVTPSGSDPEVRLGSGTSTPSGDVVCFATEKAIAGSASNGLVTTDDGFCARRTSAGWETEWVTGPGVREQRGTRGSQVYYLSPDGARVAFASDQGIFPDFPGLGGGEGNVFGTLSAFMFEAGETRWLAPTPFPVREDRIAGQPANYIQREPLAVSTDLGHGIFLSAIRLVPQDGNEELDIYEWTPSGIRLVSRDATGAAVGGFPAMGTDIDQTVAEPGSITQDGSRIFFERRSSTPLAGEPADAKTVFMREGDRLTLVSPRRGPGPAEDVLFAGAYADGAVVYLRTAEQLTDEPKETGPALYRYDVARDELALVVSHPDGIFFLGASADGSTVVYRTGSLELHVLRGGTDALVGTLEFPDILSVLDGGAGTRTDKRSMRIAPDGSSVVFASVAGLDGPASGFKQVFRWTAEGGVRRISQDATGTAPAGDAELGNFSTIFPGRPRQSSFNFLRFRPNLGRAMSDDGGRIFFETGDPLVAADINGFIDVYEWRDGAVRLVSPGTQRGDAFFHDNSADGSTVFFVTEARIIPDLDRNVSRDLYAAREGGGFPLPIPPQNCQGDACQSNVPEPPTLARGGSSSFDGPGDAADRQSPTPRHSVVRLTARQRRAFARSGRASIRVRVSEKGFVTAAATARFRRRAVRVAQSTRAARRGSTLSLPLNLSQRARTVLRTTRRLRLTISVAYSESDTTIRQVVVLRG